MNFNPLSPDAIDRTIIAEFYRNQNLHPLADLSSFDGEGVYFIFSEKLPYYHDKFQPIYIGKAVNRGGRKGLMSSVGKALYSRLGNHAKSINLAKNLDIDDFKFKVLTMDQVWIAYCEGVFIRHFQPIWNTGYEGFGNKEPGVTRATQKLSLWDRTHPGRRDATIVPDRPDPVDVGPWCGTVDVWSMEDASV